jgi:hypothetical protein
MVGDGGRLLINGTYKLNNGASMNITQIGVADNSATNGGFDNTCITLYEEGYISYYSSFADKNVYGHSFTGRVRIFEKLAIVDNSPHVSSNILFQVGSEGSSVKVDAGGNLYVNAIKGATNVTIKATISITADQQKTINGISVYKYDLDISKYTNYFQAVGFKVRHFKITSIYSNASYLDGSNPDFTKYMFSNEYYMTDYNGLTLACNDSWTNGQCEFISNTIPLNYWIRNSFNYMTFINQLSIGGNRTWYIMVQDYLA